MLRSKCSFFCIFFLCTFFFYVSIVPCCAVSVDVETISVQDSPGDQFLQESRKDLSILPRCWSESIHFISKEENRAVVYSFVCVLLFSGLALVGGCLLLRKKTKELKNTNDAFRQSEERYRAWLDETLDLRYRTDCQGKLVYISRSVERITGYVAAEVIGKRAIDFYMSSAVKRKFVTAIKTKGYVNNFVAPLRRKGGKILWAATNAQVYKDQNGNILAVYGAVRDITERKQVQIVLERSEQRLQLALEGADIGMWDWNIVTNEVYRSPKYYSMLGYGPSELPNTHDTWLDLLHPDDRITTDRKVQDVVAKGKGHWSLEFRLRAQDGSYRWILGRGKIVEFSENGTSLRASGTQLDITRRKEAEKNVLIAKKEWEQTFDAVPEMVTLHDMEMRIIRANKSAIDFSGKNVNQLLGLRCSDVFTGIHDFCSDCQVIDILKNNKSYEYTIQHEQQGKIFQVSFSPVLDQNNKPQFFVRIAKDITELKHLEKQLLLSQKMEALGMMAGGVAHDLNNILAGIINYPELMLMQLPESSEFRPSLEAMQQSGMRAAMMVADLLTVARGAASIKKPYDIHVLINEYLRSPEYQELLQRNAAVHCSSQLDAQSSIICCSSIHIKKVIMNLVCNAVESIKGTGSVNISTKNCHVKATVDPAEQKIEPGKYVLMTVQDNGAGISQVDQEHIFEPFYSTKTMGQSGTGLGLTIVWNSVQDHGGRVFIESSEQGTIFHVYLPASSETVQEDKGGTEDLTGSNERVLVVDDEPQLCDIACQVLTNLGYNVDTVPSGEAAIEFVKDTPVDVLVIDMLMEPGINGRQTYERILQQYPNQKAIVASGFSESNDVKNTLALGASELIKKPYTMNQLGLAMKKALHTFH